jgi:hypothetical protein
VQYLTRLLGGEEEGACEDLWQRQQVELERSDDTETAAASA